jgi:hypothetical protein
MPRLHPGLQKRRLNQRLTVESESGSRQLKALRVRHFGVLHRLQIAPLLRSAQWREVQQMRSTAVSCARGEDCMGYDVHITRKQSWFDEDGSEISLAEWLAVVRADPDMRFDGYAETTVDDGSVLRIEDEGLSVWTAYSRHGENGMAWFSFGDGNVTVKNPDPEILRKMWSLAQVLSARVQGDEGELYDASGRQTG